MFAKGKHTAQPLALAFEQRTLYLIAYIKYETIHICLPACITNIFRLFGLHLFIDKIYDLFRRRMGELRHSTTQ